MAATSMKVFVRIRKGKATNRKMLYSDKSIQITTTSNNKIFNFEGVFNPDVSQSELYARAIAPHVEDALVGYNCTVFVYGQTATGKTYTMEGILSTEINDHCQNGIIPRSFIHIMESIHSSPCTSELTISFFEIYNEEIIDLIGQHNSNSKLQIYENEKEEYIIKNLTKIKIHNCNQLLMYLEEGANKRKKLSTLLNKLSSRSHRIFSIWIRRMDTSTGLCTNGKIDFIDLAGSENVSKSGIAKKNYKETSNINKSLLTLGRVIKGLSNKERHIPYRESNLTRILKGSLNGNTKTIMIATVTTDPRFADETLKTLEYASNAQLIINQIYPNTELGNNILEINSIQDEIAKNEEIEELKLTLGATDAANLEQLLQIYDTNQRDLFTIERDCEVVKEEEICPLEIENEKLNIQLEKLKNVRSDLLTVNGELQTKVTTLIDFLHNVQLSLTKNGSKEELMLSTLKVEIDELLMLYNDQLNIFKDNEKKINYHENLKNRIPGLLSQIKESQDLVEKLEMNSCLLTKYFPLGGERLSSKVLDDTIVDELTSQRGKKLQTIVDNADKLSTLSQTNTTLLSKLVTSIKLKLFGEEPIDVYSNKTENNLDDINNSVDPYDGLIT